MTSRNEPKARLIINDMLKESGWRFFDEDGKKANIQLEGHVTITQTQLDAFGNDFESTRHGYVDFLLLDDKGFPLVVLEAKKESINPLSAKEQAREYANSIDVRYIILSNGQSHYFWDMGSGNPQVITRFPTPESLQSHAVYTPDPTLLINESVETDYVAITQKHDYQTDPRWLDASQRGDFIKDNGLMFLRDYQLNAVRSIQKAVSDNQSRFLFEMATGTGKTLISAAVIKLFLRTKNAKRVLFLVDRLELEDQADRAFTRYLKNDFNTAIYKNARDTWNRAEIVISTVQSLTDKFNQLFSPTDFDLIISDEAHRSINGNARAVFEYFIGYKLGLTATPKDYLKNIKDISRRDPREIERRQLLDTYTTFGCSSGEPTFRYSLIDGVKDGYLISPSVSDARTDITTQLLSDKGYAIQIRNAETGEDEENIFTHRDFERKFFSEKTNHVLCETFMTHALRDPISGEIGKTIVFCVSQNHAATITQMLNTLAHKEFPGRYNSDFAVQVTSLVPGAQQFTINFANNNLNGKTRFLESYNSSKTRVSVTVGMMTTGYDCQNIQNLCLMRPIFSPTDFVQIKGRGTRTFTFSFKAKDSFGNWREKRIAKESFKIFDFFANFEYFEEKFNYDEELPVVLTGDGGGTGGGPIHIDEFDSQRDDHITKVAEATPASDFWKIDLKYWGSFQERVQSHDLIRAFVEQGNLPAAEKYIHEHIFDKPEEYFTLEKIQKSIEIDRKLSLKELLEKVFNLIPHFKTKAEKLDEECNKFISIYKPDPEQVLYIRNFLKAYITDSQVRNIVESREYARLATSPIQDDFSALLPEWREQIPLYVNDYVSLDEYQ